MPPAEPLRLVDALHLKPEPDGGAQVVDDRTFAAAHVNRSARILLEALQESPRTEHDLTAVLAEAAECAPEEAAGPVAELVRELRGRGWVELSA